MGFNYGIEDIKKLINRSKALVNKKEKIKHRIEKEIQSEEEKKKTWKMARKTKICMECGGELYSTLEDTGHGCQTVWYCKSCDFKQEGYGIGIIV